MEKQKQLIDAVSKFNKTRNGQLIELGFRFDDIKNIDAVIVVLNKYIGNDDPLLIDDMIILGLIDDVPMWDIM